MKLHTWANGVSKPLVLCGVLLGRQGAAVDSINRACACCMLTSCRTAEGACKRSDGCTCKPPHYLGLLQHRGEQTTATEFILARGA